MPKVAVLTNGPSLKELWHEGRKEHYDIVMGINTSAWIFSVDVWAVLDPDVVRLSVPVLSGINGTKVDSPLQRGEIPVPKKMCTFKEFKNIPQGSEVIDMPWYNRKSHHLPDLVEQKHGIRQCNYTFPNALYVASLLSEGGQVDVWGMDMSPETDVVGKAGDRTGERWRRELPWVSAAWQHHWNVFGRASPMILDYLYGRIDFSSVVGMLGKYQGGLTHKKVKAR